MVALALTCGIFLFAVFSDSNPVLFIIFGIAFGIALPLSGLMNYVGALSKSILQMSINKKKIG